MALELIRFCEDRGIKIPEDLSIVGFDGIKIGKVLHPILTTMEQDSAEKGRRAVEELLSLIRGDEILPHSEERKKDCEREYRNREYNDREDCNSEKSYKNILLPASLCIGETVAKQ